MAHHAITSVDIDSTGTYISYLRGLLDYDDLSVTLILEKRSYNTDRKIYRVII